MLAKVCYNSKKFFKQNGTMILTCIGAFGVVTTAATAVKATPKALRLIEEAKEEKGEDLTVFETIKVAGPVYIPPIAIGVGTIFCIFGANALNKHQQATMASAYMMLDRSYKDYRKKVAEKFGESGEREVRKAVMEANLQGIDIDQKEDELLFYEPYSNKYFNMTMLDFKDVIYHFNRNFAILGYADLNALYNFLHLPSTDLGSTIGWSSGAGAAWYGYQWIDFRLVKSVTDDGLECYYIEYPFEPTADFMYY